MRKIILIILSLNLIGCATYPKGAMQFGVPFKDTATCSKGKIIYRDISIITHWKEGTMLIQYSWQCHVSNKDSKRYYKVLGKSDYFETMRRQ